MRTLELLGKISLLVERERSWRDQLPLLGWIWAESEKDYQGILCGRSHLHLGYSENITVF